MAEYQFTKQAYEEFVISADFSDNLITGEAIDTQSAAAVDKDGTDVASTILDAATLTNDGAGKVTILVKGGTASGSPYKITLKAVTDHVTPHKWELDIFMRIKES